MGVERKIFNHQLLTTLKDKPGIKLNITQIQELVAMKHDLPNRPDRKTVSQHLARLADLSDRDGIEEGSVRSEKIGTSKYYWFEPAVAAFTTAEIKLLSDAIASSRMIGKELSERLIEKLWQTQGRDIPGDTRYFLKSKTSDNIYNPDLFDNIALLAEAIENKRKVKLLHLKYNLKKELVPIHTENDGYITISPHKLHWTLDHYYLMYTREGADMPYFLRVDKVKDVTVLDDRAVEPNLGIYHKNDYSRNQAFMFGGKLERIKLKCHMKMLGQAIDFFGEAAELKRIGDTHFELQVLSSVESMRFWVLQYSTAIDDLSPKALKETLLKDLKEALERIEG